MIADKESMMAENSKVWAIPLYLLSLIRENNSDQIVFVFSRTRVLGYLYGPFFTGPNLMLVIRTPHKQSSVRSTISSTLFVYLE